MSETNVSQTEATQEAIRDYWAKYDPETGDIHRLEHHLADVGAVMKLLLSIPSIRRATANVGRIDDLDPTTAARLGVFAALHDIGKTNLSFQGKRYNRWGASHTKDMMQLLNSEDIINQERFVESMQWLNEALANWDLNDGETVCGMLLAMLSHHGKPEKLNNGHHTRSEHWHDPQDRQGQPFDKVREIAIKIKEWFPDAFIPDAVPLPSNPEFQHHFLGLLMLADWIGSDRRWFTYQPSPDPRYFWDTAIPQAMQAITTIGLDISEQRIPSNPATLAEIVDRPEAQPNAMQNAVVGVKIDEPVVILESETGSGKTEAALLHFQRLRRAGLVDGMYFALPTRAAAVQIHQRITQAVKRIMPDARDPVLAVPGYIRVGGHDGSSLPRYRVHWEDGADDGSRWAAESAKRFLAAQIAVGTIDQAMLSVMQTSHAHLRAACLARNLLVIDEVHASDTYMMGITQGLVQNHTLKGGHTLMMSATLGASARSAYLNHQVPDVTDSKMQPYPCISTHSGTVATGLNDRHKQVRINTMPAGQTPHDVATLALNAQQAGAKVLVIRNTVGLAVATVRAIEEQVEHPEDSVLSINGKAVAHHSRFSAEDRKQLDGAAQISLGARGDIHGVVVVGTQTLEQSLDIDADYLVTDLCPMDVLLQRIGRLHRWSRVNRPAAYSSPTCMVLIPDDEPAVLINKRSATGLGPRGRVYHDLRVLEATRQQIFSHLVWNIPDMNRQLVEDATHPKRLQEIVDADPVTWTQHHNEMRGTVSANQMTAASVLVDWSKPFYDHFERENLALFNAGNVMTRLAESSIEVEFEDGVIGPFGTLVSKIAVPHWMLGDVDISHIADQQALVAQVTEMGPDGFVFTVPGETRTLRYSRFGVSRA